VDLQDATEDELVGEQMHEVDVPACKSSSAWSRVDPLISW
jgi:hypothetical protein